MPVAWHQDRKVESRMTTLVCSCEYLVGRWSSAAGRGGGIGSAAASERCEGCAESLVDVDQLFQLVHGKHLADHGGGVHWLRGILRLQFGHQETDERALRLVRGIGGRTGGTG